MNILKIKKLRDTAKLPEYAHSTDSGMDLFSDDDPIMINPGDTKLVRTGISIELPENVEAHIRPRSGLALKHSITVLNTPGTIDEGYRGEIGIILINHGKEAFLIERHMKIAQMVVQPIVRVRIMEVEELSDTDRKAGGFGSTGVK